MKAFISRVLTVFIIVVALLATQTLLADERWTPRQSLDVKRLSDLSFSPDDKNLLYGIHTTDLKNDAYVKEFVISDANGGNVRTLLEASKYNSAVQWSPDGKWVAYLSSQSGNNNLRLIASKGGEGTSLTNFSHDISSFRWAPDGKAITFVMSDPDYKEPAVQDPEVFNKNHLWLLRLDGGKPSGEAVNLTEGQDFTVSDWSGNWAFDWAPDSGSIVFAHQAGPGLDDWTKAQLSVVNVATKRVTRIATDNDHWKYFPKYSPDGKWIAYINAPGPFKWSFLWDIKLVPAQGGTPKKLAPSKNQLPFPWEWAPDSKSLYYVENDRVTYSFYRMPIDGSAYQKIFGAPKDLSIPGLNTYLVSSFVDVSGDGKRLAMIGQTSATPPEIYIGEVETFTPQKISSINGAFDAIPLGKTELTEWHSLDNTKVEGLLTYPVNYEHGERYPLVVQIHGGPNGVDFNEYLPLIKFFATPSYAAKDYFVLRVNYRGTLGYGREFREDLIGKFGVVDYQDIISGVGHVINRGLVDPDQLFVVGQSNGGTLTSWIVTQTDMFKAACPIAGETDYISLEGTNEYFQTSWYLGGSFIHHLQRFLDRSPIFHVENATTPTLIQGGLLDENVPHTQLQEFYRALKRVGVKTKLVGYPNSDHDYYPPKLYLKLLRSCLDWTEVHREEMPSESPD